MPRRPANVTQADIARAIRAAQAAGLTIVRIVVRSDGVAVETSGARKTGKEVGQQTLADEERVVVL